MARILSAQGILVLVQTGILVFVTFLVASYSAEEARLSEQAVDSHICLRAERSPIILRGCKSSVIEKVNPRETRGRKGEGR